MKVGNDDNGAYEMKDEVDVFVIMEL